jgi:HEAT repeat protein
VVAMSSAGEYAAYYLERLRRGQAEEAFYGLIEAEPAVLPVLIEAFANEADPVIRAEIVRCIGQHRRPEAVGFLAEVLHDPAPTVWQEALDGLVALGDNQAIQALQAAWATVPAGRGGRAITAEWIEEALEQVRDRAAE